MENKEKCEMVKDLAIPFISKLLHTETENFVNAHLSTCEKCREYYNNIQNELSTENITEKDKDNIVINQFKKINKHMSILKISLFIIIFSILTIVLAFYIKNQKLVKIIDNSYSKIEYMRGLDNYKLIVRTIEKDLKTDDFREYEQIYYYKNGKYKIESADSIRFYEDNSYEKICVYHDLKQINYYKQNFIEVTKGKTMGIFSEIINYKNISSTFYSLALSVREERYNGIDCYVIRFGNNSSYRDTWIDKNKNITVRVVNENVGEFYREDIYTFYENVTNDENVDSNILDSDKYKNYTRNYISNNATDEIRLFYGLYNKE